MTWATRLKRYLQKYHALLQWGCLGVSIALGVWVNHSSIGQVAGDLWRYGGFVTVAVLFFEAFFIAGIAMMLIGYGQVAWQAAKKPVLIGLASAAALVGIWLNPWQHYTVMMTAAMGAFTFAVLYWEELGKSLRALENFAPARVIKVATSTKPDFVVWSGFWLNYASAVMQGLFLIVAGVLFMPSYLKWSVALFGMVDLALTFMRCVPMKGILETAAGKLHVTTATATDIAAYTEAQLASWGSDMAAPEEIIAARVNNYREGILVARDTTGKPVGFVTTILLNSYDFDNPKSWDETTGDGRCWTHCPDGKIMFGVDMSKMPDAPAGDKVFDDLLLHCMCRMFKKNLEIACLGGRLPGYHRYASQMTAEEYLRKQRDDGCPLDYQVRMYLSIPGVKALGVIPNYFPDPPSLNYGVLLRWDNPVCSRTNRRWWRIFMSNQLSRNILAWMVPRVTAAEMAYNEWRHKRQLDRQPSQ